MLLCLVGDDEDLSVAYVGWLAEQRGAEVLTLREDRFGLDWTFRHDGGDVSLDIGDRRLRGRDVDGMFVRLNPQPAVPDELGLESEAESLYVIERRHALHWLLDHAELPVMNRPSAGRSNGSKPYQMRLLGNAGFLVPRWVVTNQPHVTEEFVADCPEGVVYKACSGLRSRVRYVDRQLLERQRIGTSPVVLQAYVPGTDARLHVVGGRVFATEIAGDGVDYRFDGDGHAFRPMEPPAAVAQRCVTLTEEEGLLLAGFDFRIDPAGTWWCLEGNPVPTFLPYEAGSGNPLGDGIIDTLLPSSAGGHQRSPLRLTQ